MPMPAVLGTIALQGQSGGGGGGGGAPSSVSIATSSSGNYDNAVLVEEIAVGFGEMDMDGSGFSSNAGANLVSISNMESTFPGNSGQATLRVSGYIRATNATSFQWNLTFDTLGSTLTNGTGSTSGTPSTSQDATSGGISENGILTFGGGRGGLLFPSANDELVFQVDASATNSNGTTNASSVEFKYIFS